MKKFLLIILFCNVLNASELCYLFSDDFIDVVIPSVEKDLKTLDSCIDGIKANCSQVRRVIVVSEKRLTDRAEWFDEALYPFSKDDIALSLLKGNEVLAKRFMKKKGKLGWYYQQLLKYYAPFVIPGISSNVLVLDSDAVFINQVEFLDDHFAGLYNVGSEFHKPYFRHASRLLPGLHRLYPEYSGITHHMIFQKPVLQDLFDLVEMCHKMPLWKAFCRCVSLENLQDSGASEYEIYFNFVLSRTNQVHIRPLKWLNAQDTKDLISFKEQGYHYVTFHSWIKE